MAAYVLAEIEITNADGYKEYTATVPATIAQYGGRFLVRAGAYETVEGSSRSRNAVIEFPSYQAALDCWRSPDYQAAIRLREPVSTADVVVIEGYDGPQP